MHTYIKVRKLCAFLQSFNRLCTVTNIVAAFLCHENLQIQLYLKNINILLRIYYLYFIILIYIFYIILHFAHYNIPQLFTLVFTFVDPGIDFIKLIYKLFAIFLLNK
jgi:hypothetical protein